MEDKHRTILRDNRPNIVKDLEPNNILPDLGSVLTPKDDADIKAQSKRQERCEQLLEIIPRKGPNAFKVFVEALKKEVPHLADDLIEADELKTKLEPDKQGHTKTSQELEELRSLRHETFITQTSQQIRKLAEIVQQLTDDSCSPCNALRNLRDSTERETQTSEIQELTKGITKMVEGYQSLQKEHGDLSQELDKSKEDALKLKKELEKSQRNLAYKNERVKEYQQKLQAQSKTIDDLSKKLLRNAMENKSVQKREVLRLRSRFPQIFSHSEDFDKRGDTGRQDEPRQLLEVTLHRRAYTREPLPCIAVLVTSGTPFREFSPGVENLPSCIHAHATTTAKKSKSM